MRVAGGERSRTAPIELRTVGGPIARSRYSSAGLSGLGHVGSQELTKE